VKLFIRRGLTLVLTAECLFALATSLRYVHTLSHWMFLLDGLCIAAFGLSLYFLIRESIHFDLDSFATPKCCAMVILLGIALRLGWVLVMPPVQLSDFASYVHLGRQLAQEGRYIDGANGTLLAFRPVGYPLFLSGFFRILGDREWLPALTNLLLFVATALLIVSAAQSFGGKKAALAALSLFALWPSNIFLTGLAASEPLTMFLFTAGLWFFAMTETDSSRSDSWQFAIAAGALAGASALTRPTFILFPLLWAGLLLAEPSRGRLRDLAIASTVMLAVITPWTVRNYRVLHAFVPISTNGGSVFYRANNELATGTFEAVGKEDLSPLKKQNEVKWNDESYRLGKLWIKTHPRAFAVLAIHKAIFFTQDDETGIYWSMKRGHHLSGNGYLALALLSDAWWQLLCLLTLAVVSSGQELIPNSRVALLASGVALLFVVHMVYESQSRYHVPGIVTSSVLAHRGSRVFYFTVTPGRALTPGKIRVPVACAAVIPVPVKATDCGLSEAESVNTSVSDRSAAEVGEKVTETVQEAPASTVAPQVVVFEN
jgi:hypothetical protein